jgi:hypothetical protein
MPDETPKTGDNYLRSIDPEHLLVVEKDEIAPLLDVQYRDLAERSTSLLVSALAWLSGHTDPATGLLSIPDDATQNEASDLYQQLADHAGRRSVDRAGRVTFSDSGELKECRDKVARPLRAAINAGDAWFHRLRDPIGDVMGAITAAQDAFGAARAERERRERQAQIQAARAEAARIAEEQRQIAREARQRAHEATQQVIQVAARSSEGEGAFMAALEAEDRAADEARQIEEDAARKILEADTKVQIVTQQAAVSQADLTRTKSVLGTTTSQGTSWIYEVVDLMKLLQAIVKGEVPMNFVMPANSVINAVIRGNNGLRQIPGLEVKPVYSTRRRGG